MNTIYIVLTDTGTLFTKLIKCFTKSPYNHASIALSPELFHIYSFGRKSLRLPWKAGFVKERMDDGIYLKQRNTTCAVYELRVNDEQLGRIEQELQRFEQDSDCLRYNFLGLFTFLLGVETKRRNAYFCSEFVATLLQSCGVNVVGKPPGLTAPHDFMRTEKLHSVYEGKLSEYAS